MSTAPVIGSSFCGLSLNPGQKLAVKCALLKKKLDQDLNIVFWGKIMGTEKDFLIAKSLKTGKMDFETKFYVSVDEGVSFSELLPCSEQKKKMAAEQKFNMFKGNLQFRYGPPPPDPDDPDQKVPDSRLTEEERLYYVVEAIDRETCIVPKGAHVLTATSRVIPNVEFKGLSSLQAKKLSSYVLLQKPTEHKTITKIKCRGAANTTDFLDGIMTAKPKGVWTVQTDKIGLNVTLRHLRWTGYEFHTTVGENWFEGAYFGYGLENHDIALMV